MPYEMLQTIFLSHLIPNWTQKKSEIVIGVCKCLPAIILSINKYRDVSKNMLIMWWLVKNQNQICNQTNFTSHMKR